MNQYDKKPKIEHGENNVRIGRVCINLENGLDEMTAYFFTEETNKFPNHIYLGKPIDDKYELYSAKEIMSLTSMKAKKGNLVDVIVETKNPVNPLIKNNNAEEIAKRIYQGLTTQGMTPIFEINDIGKKI